MHAALRLGLGHALHAVHARLVLEGAVDILARHLQHHLLVAACGAVGEGGDFVAPALALDVFGVHAQQVAGEDRRLVAARAAADLDDGILRVLGVLGYEQQLDLLLHRRERRFEFGDLAAGHLAHLLVAVVGQDVLGFGQVGQCRAVAFGGLDDRFQLLVILGELYELFHVGDHFGVGEFLSRLLVFEFQAVETAQNGVVCHSMRCLRMQIYEIRRKLPCVRAIYGAAGRRC